MSLFCWGVTRFNKNVYWVCQNNKGYYATLTIKRIYLKSSLREAPWIDPFNVFVNEVLCEFKGNACRFSLTKIYILIFLIVYIFNVVEIIDIIKYFMHSVLFKKKNFLIYIKCLWWKYSVKEAKMLLKYFFSF